MDAAGKDGVIRQVMSGVNPQGCQVFSFKQPSAEELEHDFLWRTTKRLPERGRIDIFNRSYYEEVLIVRVHPEILRGQGLPDELHDERALWRSGIVPSWTWRRTSTATARGSSSSSCTSRANRGIRSMQRYNDFWISGRAVPGPPNTEYWTPAGAVLLRRDNGSVVELVRFNLESFDLADQGVAALFGLELARLMVDTAYPELVTMQRDVERRPDRPPPRR